MDLQLARKRASVTGSSDGIGKVIAKTLAAEGAAVAVHGRDENRTREVVSDIVKAGGRAIAIFGDITQDSDVEKMGDAGMELLGSIDILVINAGGSGDKQPWEQTSPGDWQALYDRNVLSIVRLSRCFIPGMRAAGWGRVVNISSGAASMPAATGPDYSACKAAVNNLTVSLSKDVGKDGITVNAVSPGPILTPKLERVFRDMARSRGCADDGRGPWNEPCCKEGLSIFR